MTSEDEQWTPQESQEVGEWLQTEPGMRMRLANRQAQLDRLIALGAPQVILDRQREMIEEIARQLGEGNES